MSSQTHARQTIRGNPGVQAVLAQLLRTQYLGVPELREATGLPDPQLRGIMRRLYLDGMVAKSPEWHTYNNKFNNHCRLKKYTINSEFTEEIRELIRTSETDTGKVTS